MKVSVIVPTYKRSEDLKRCVKALSQQTRPADEVFVVYHKDDLETVNVKIYLLTLLDKLVFLEISKTSQVASMNLALNEASGDIICFTDDDSAPRVDWIEKIERHFLDDKCLGGLGGRDAVVSSSIKRTSDIIGIFTSYGRIIGRHNFESDGIREVDHLKGVNMSYRIDAIKNLFFDQRLRGKAECRNDMAFSLAVKKRGWKVLYDPEVVVDHYVAVRNEDTQRGSFVAQTTIDEAFNETLVLLSYLPFRRKIIALSWAFFCGNVAMPGPVQFFRKTMYSRTELWQRFCATIQGRLQACREHLK